MKRMHTDASPAARAGLQPQRLLGLFLGLTLGLMLAFASAAARAADDPPGRVGRLADFNGSVSWWDSESGEWASAERNRPLTTGDRVSTAASGRAELRVGSSVLRLANNTEVEVLRLDDEKLVFQLHSGSVALRVRSREIAEETEVITEEARLLPQRAGHYRIDRDDDTTQAGSWRGELRVHGAEGESIGAGQRVELYRQGRGGNAVLRSTNIAMPSDGFSVWVTSEEQREERSASTRYVSPEMTGAEELDRHGRWEQHPEYGALWLPLVVQAGWAPYRHGRWAWVRPWGWTWIDEAPWGFAPFHYGRWVNWRGRWGWVPGAYVSRPVYAPALVAWVGGAGWGLSVNLGGPTVGWVPLAPREVYRPYYRSTPRYVERVNPVPPYRWRHPPEHVPTGPVSYGNQGVPNAVTVVPSDVLVRRQPVSRGAMEVPDGPRGGPRLPLNVLPPPPGPTGANGGFGPQGPARSPYRRPAQGGDGEGLRPVQVVPGGAVPLPRPEQRPELRPEPRFEPGSDQRPPRVDSARDREDNRGRSDQGRLERPREVQTVPKMERAERPDRMERPDRADRPERPERAERPERPERPDRAPRPEAPPPRAEPRPVPTAAPAPAPAPGPAPERAGPPRPAPVPERAQVPGRERTQDRERDRQSQR